MTDDIRLRETLIDVRTAIERADPEVLVDTLWFGDGETVVDRINCALEDITTEELAKLFSPNNLETFQKRVVLWVTECLTAGAATDRKHRINRAFEEFCEVAQAGGMSREWAHQLVDYTFDREMGDLRQEIGGAMLTIAALAESHGHDMMVCAEQELARVWTKFDVIRAKEAAKPSDSPLPGPAEPRWTKESAAVATLERLGYTHRGGQLWAPPLGKAPAFDGDVVAAPAEPDHVAMTFVIRMPPMNTFVIGGGQVLERVDGRWRFVSETDSNSAPSEPAPVKMGYHLTKCEHCGWTGSSEDCSESSFDDCDIVCPSCHCSFLCAEIREAPVKAGVDERRKAVEECIAIVSETAESWKEHFVYSAGNVAIARMRALLADAPVDQPHRARLCKDCVYRGHIDVHEVGRCKLYPDCQADAPVAPREG